MDSSVANYQVNWCKRKWWWPLFSWSLSVQAVNAWRLKQRFTGKKEPYLKFLRDNIRYPNYLPNYLTTYLTT